MKKKRKLSQSRYNESYDDRDKGGATRQGFIDWKKVEGSSDRKFYSPRDGVNKLNIIPYEIKSKLNPQVKAGKAEVGDIDFMLDVWVHRFAGPSSEDILCPKKNYGKACPLCEKRSEYYEKGDKESAKKFNPSRRVLLNVQPIKGGEAQELQIFEVSHYLFMKELVEEAHACKNGDDIIPFADIEVGKVVKFRAQEGEIGKNKMQEYKSFDFLDREEELDENIIDKALSFDEGLVFLSYDGIEKLMYGQDTDEKDEKQDDGPEEKPIKKDPDPEPEKKPNPEPEEKKETAPEKGKCPQGHKFGEEGKHGKDCKGCKVWDECCDASI